jgi:alpha-glucosidase
MIAVRKGRADLMQGNTVFLDVPEPLLVFRRGAGTTCIYNLSPAAYSLGLAGTGAMVIGEAADISEGRLTLGPNGFAILDGAGAVTA